MQVFKNSLGKTQNKKKTNVKRFSKVFLVIGIIIFGSSLLVFYQGFNSDEIIESIESERFGDASNRIPTQIEPQIDSPILESFDNIPKPKP